MRLHAGRLQRGLQRRCKSIQPQRQQHVRGRTTRPRAGHGLISPLAAGVSLEIVPEHGLPWRGDMGCTNDKVEVGRAGNKNHGHLIKCYINNSY